MAIVRLELAQRRRIASLYAGWDRELPAAYLQGHMGYALADSITAPASAQIVVGDFCFFAGQPHAELAAGAAAPIMVARSAAWESLLAAVWEGRARRHLRYSIRRAPGGFDTAKLMGLTELPPGFTLSRIDAALCEALLRESWSRDLCALFGGGADFYRRGLGFAALYRGEPVAGASSYAVYDDGIEIEIDTAPGFRRRGLAAACGARLVLECLRRGLYPCWDAHDQRSAALAGKLGYPAAQAYPVLLKL